MATSITIKGLDVVQKRMRGLLKEVQSSPSSMTKIGLLGVRDVIQHFKREESDTGRRWGRITHRQGAVLQDTGLLRASTRFKVLRNDVLLFNNTRYGKYHQFGTSRMPSRKWMWIASKTRKQMANNFLKGLMTGYIRGS